MIYKFGGIIHYIPSGLKNKIHQRKQQMNLKSIIQTSRPVILGSTAVFLFSMNSLSANAADDSPFSISASVGIEYDSNITVQEVDVDTGEGDIAGLIDFSANYEFEATSSTSFEVGYSFSQSLHEDATGFDLQTHLVTANAKQKFDGFDVGLNYLYINTSLGGDSFLEIHKVSPYVAFFAAPSVYVRAAYSYTDKDLETSNERDAETHAVGASVFYFMNHSKTYLMFSYRYDSLDANADRFDYDGHDIKLRYQVKFPFAGRDARFRIGGRYVKRNYDAITPSIGEVRNDERVSLETMIEIPFWEMLNARLKYRYTDATSNLSSADYQESLVSFEIGFEF